MALCNRPAPFVAGTDPVLDWHPVCLRPAGHAGDHGAEFRWTGNDPAAWDVHPPAALPLDEDEAPTQKLPPITETVRRRPPVPGAPRVTELTGVELVEALMAELVRERDEARDGGDEL